MLAAVDNLVEPNTCVCVHAHVCARVQREAFCCQSLEEGGKKNAPPDNVTQSLYRGGDVSGLAGIYEYVTLKRCSE